MGKHKKKKPEIRFKGFTDDWEQRKLGNIASKVKIKNNGMTYTETFTNSAEQGIISQRDYFDHDVSNAENIDGYYIVENNDFVYNPRISSSAPVGPINRNTLGRTGVMSPLYTVFRISDNDFVYMEWLFKSNYWHKFMFLNGDSGARADRFSIKDSIFFDMPISVPCIEEQKQVGEYFSKLDNLITLHQRKLNKLKKVKKSMLEKMFPQNGEIEPQIRFCGFNSTWEQRKLGWLVDNDVIEAPKDGNHGEKHPTSDEYVEKGIPFLMASDIHNGRVDLENCKYITKERAKRLDKGFAREGDVLLTHKATIGEVAILEGLQEEYAMLTPQVTYYRILDNKRLSHKYLYAVFHSESFQNEMQTKAAQSTRPYIGISAQQNLTISLPCSTKEQQRIGEYFASLDTFITLHQRKLEKLKKIKKAMLEKMFV